MLYDPRPLHSTGYPTQRASNIKYALKAGAMFTLAVMAVVAVTAFSFAYAHPAFYLDAEGSPIEATELLGP